MPYVSKSQFNRVGVNIDGIEDQKARAIISQLIKTIDDTHSKLNNEMLLLERAVNTAGSTNIVVTGGGGSSSSGSGISVVTNHRAQSASLVAGTSSQFIAFSTPISSSFVLIWRTANTAGDLVGVTILPTNITANGFTVTDCLEDCVLHYQVLPIA